MKKLLLVASIVAIPGLALAQYYPPPGGYYYPHDRFEHHKWDKVHDLDAQIRSLQAKRDCIAHAGNPPMMEACENPQPVFVQQAPPPVIVAPAPPPQNNLVLGVHIH